MQLLRSLFGSAQPRYKRRRLRSVSRTYPTSRRFAVDYQRQDSAWVAELVTNATFFDHPFDRHHPGEGPPQQNVQRQSVYLSLSIPSYRMQRAPLGDDRVESLLMDYGEDVPMRNFAGITLDDLYRTETTFKTNIFVYTLVEATDGKTTAELVRRSLCHYTETTINLHGTHFSDVQDVKQYSHSYRCRECGESLWKRMYLLQRHQRSCQGGAACIIHHRQFIFYEQRGINMFKDGISVPGLTLLYRFNDLPPKTYFTMFNEKHNYLHRLVND